jgi:hypothetical protein
MVFAQYLETVADVLGNNLPVAVGGGVAVVVLTTLVIGINRRRRAGLLEEALPAATGTTPPPDEKVLNWSPPEQSYADRRGSVRREGGPVRVLLSSPIFRNGVGDGFVVDRSTGGLRIVMQAAIAPGRTLQVRAANAPDTVGFITVIVRSCRETGDHFEVGCEFEKTPPWNILLLFG